MRHVLDIYLHLISNRVFDDECYHSHFSEGKWKLIKDSLVVARGTKSRILYMLSLNTVEEFFIKLWYKQLAHKREGTRHAC